jgi:predicted metal-dependent HD superfamily phosphohydrolase
MSPLSSIPWAEVEELGVRTTEDGPVGEDLFWHFVLRDGSIEIPGALVAEPELAEIDAHLPGLDYGNIIRATTSTAERMFRIWHHVDSRYRPDRDALRKRFSALVGKLGGNPDASASAFDALYAAWSAESRRYHDLNHLVDCMRELDAANAPAATADLAELALWYHDAIYEAGAPDCEERSARLLESDAADLALPRTVAGTAADLVRATAHGRAAARTDLAAQLVLDVDLSILGKDPLRFMDFDYGVEEEYAGIPTRAFRTGRARFLATMLERDCLYLTDYFHARYEQRARLQIAALLASPRYQLPA